ncbi:hypothetical protein FRB99_000749 [Tulasnella sp. 403]|nr:hypothetical protein FRB99_000749 [Tulasnella sp. 403]
MSKRWFVRAASTSFLSPQKLSLPPAAKDSSKQKSRSLPLDDGGTPKTRSSTISDVDTNRPHTASGSSGKSEENDGTELLRRRTALSPDSNRLRVMKAVSLPEDRYMYVENIVRHDSLGIAVGIESVIMGDIESLSWGKHAPKASRFELCGKMDQPLLHPCRPVVILNEVRFVHCVDNDQTKKDTRSLTSVDLSTSEMRASIFTKLSPLAWVGDESVLLVDVPRTEGCYRFHLWDALGSNEVKKVGFSIKCSTPSTFQLRGGGTRDGKWIFANAIGVEAAIYSVEDDARYDIGDSTLALTMASLTVGDESKYFVMWASEGLVSSHLERLRSGPTWSTSPNSLAHDDAFDANDYAEIGVSSIGTSRIPVFDFGPDRPFEDTNREIVQTLRNENVILIMAPGSAPKHVLIPVLQAMKGSPENQNIPRKPSLLVMTDTPVQMRVRAQFIQFGAGLRSAKTLSVSVIPEVTSDENRMKEAWRQAMAKDVVVASPEVLESVTVRGILSMTQLRCIILLDGVNVRDGHQLAPLLHEYYCPLPENDRPRIFGIYKDTNLPVYFDTSCAAMERALYAKILGVPSSERQSFLAESEAQKEIIVAYNSEIDAGDDSQIFRIIHRLDPDERYFNLHFAAARQIASDMGKFASTLVWKNYMATIADNTGRRQPDDGDASHYEVFSARPPHDLEKAVSHCIASQNFSIDSFGTPGRFSDKFLKLVHVLRCCALEDDGFRCLILVKRKSTAIVLFDLLRFLAELELPSLKPQVLLSSRRSDQPEEMDCRLNELYRQRLLDVSMFPRPVLGSFCMAAEDLAKFRYSNTQVLREHLRDYTRIRRTLSQRVTHDTLDSLYPTVVVLEDPRGYTPIITHDSQVNRSLCLLTRRPLPSIPPFDLSVRGTAWKATFHPFARLELSQPHTKSLHVFTRLFYQIILQKSLQVTSREPTFLVAPLLPTWRSKPRADVMHDSTWPFHSILKYIAWDEVHQMTAADGKLVALTSSPDPLRRELVDALLDEGPLASRGPYRALGLRADLSPSSPIPGAPLYVDASTALGFYNDTASGPISVRDLGQPLIEATPVAPSPEDLYGDGSVDCVCDAVLEYLVSVYGFVYGSDANSEQLASMAAGMVKNRTLWQAGIRHNIPQYIVSEPFVQEAWFPEGFAAASTVGELGRKQQDGPKVSRKQGKEAVGREDSDGAALDNVCGASQPRRLLPDKCIADVIEAIIGAAFLSGGLEGAFRCCKNVGLSFFHAPSWADLTKGFVHPTPTSPLTDAVDGILQAIDVKLSRPEWLAAAFLPSLISGNGSRKSVGLCNSHRVLSLEQFGESDRPDAAGERGRYWDRLIFLGEAVYRFVVTEHMYRTDQKGKSGSMSTLRQMLTAPSFVGAVAEELELLSHARDPQTASAEVYRYREALRVAHESEVTRPRSMKDPIKDWWEGIEAPQAVCDLVKVLFGVLAVSEDFDLRGAQIVYERLVWPFFDAYTPRSKRPRVF